MIRGLENTKGCLNPASVEGRLELKDWELPKYPAISPAPPKIGRTMELPGNRSISNMPTANRAKVTGRKAGKTSWMDNPDQVCLDLMTLRSWSKSSTGRPDAMRSISSDNCPCDPELRNLPELHKRRWTQSCLSSAKGSWLTWISSSASRSFSNDCKFESKPLEKKLCSHPLTIPDSLSSIPALLTAS